MQQRMLRTSFLSSFVDFRSVVAELKNASANQRQEWQSLLAIGPKNKLDTEHLVLASCQVSSKSIQLFTAAQGYKNFYLLWPWPLTSKINRFQFFLLRKNLCQTRSKCTEQFNHYNCVHKVISTCVYCNDKKVSPESERYEECLFGYSCIVHTDICTFTLLFSHGNKSRAGQGALWLE